MFDDALLDVLEPGVVGVEHRPCLLQVEPVIGCLAPGQLEHGVEPGPDPRMLWRLLAHPFEPVDLSFDRSGHLLGEVTIGQLLPVVGRRLAVVAQLLLDRLELLPQQILTLTLVDSLRCFVSHLATQFERGQYFSHPVEELPKPAPDVDGFEKLHLLLQRQIRRIHGQVGQLRRVLHVEDALGDTPHAAEVEDFGDNRAVLSDQLIEFLIDHVDLGVDLGLHPQRARLIGLPGPDSRSSHP